MPLTRGGRIAAIGFSTRSPAASERFCEFGRKSGAASAYLMRISSKLPSRPRSNSAPDRPCGRAFSRNSAHFLRNFSLFSAIFPYFNQFRQNGENSGVAWVGALLLNGQPHYPTNGFGLTHLNQGTLLDLKQIKQIIELMKRSELTEFAVEEEGFKLKIRRGTNGLPIVASSRGSNSPFPGVDANSAPPTPVPAAPTTPGALTTPGAAREEPGVTYIKSPMVGTFYRAASPESKPFADVGMKVVENTVVCIIEAMKIMNEIQAETKGTVLETLVDNGQPVEYGQRLFKIKQG